ncbi:MAG: hypothetical protein Q4B28_05200 [bacterium]|nr:hypothetical protein [bacterium]
MRKVIDEIAKEQIPGLREADAHYADMIDVLDEMQEGIVYKEVARKGQLKDNAVNILKNLNNPNRLPLANRLEKYYPGLKAQIEAITMLPEIVKVYTQKSKLSKWLENNVVQIMIAGGVGGLTSGLGGILAGAGAGMISKLSQNI